MFKKLFSIYFLTILIIACVRIPIDIVVVGIGLNTFFGLLCIIVCILLALFPYFKEDFINEIKQLFKLK